jgi:hypothetical protein
MVYTHRRYSRKLSRKSTKWETGEKAKDVYIGEEQTQG